MTQRLDTPALKQQWVLDAQWTDLPEDVYEDVQRLWRLLELGNDNYMWRGSFNDLSDMVADGATVEEWFWGPTKEEQKGWVGMPLKLDALIAYMAATDIPPDENFIIHYWW